MRRSLSLLPLALLAAPAAAQTVDFNRDVRPILSNNCFACHGPDEKVRKADLRLDTREGATADRDGHAAVVPGKPDASEVVKRLTADKPGKRMPPAKTGKTLSKAEIDTLTRWVKEGAPYAKHWAYVPPARPEFPVVKNAAWPKNPIDRFILARLEKEGLSPSSEADRYALARRLALDLTGLPPTLAEADAFVKDPSPDAYEKYVDLLLRKESYGEHWARIWLDLARYADSAGYADDPPRQIWAFRDYVIKSFNANKPFDQFTIEQIAGDLLPKPTEEQIIATAFHRNTLTNNEGGTNDEEFRNVAVVDRVNTTLTTWMGTSIACCQCHNHKYDPISQKEFFGLFAILNNTADADRGDESPVHSFYSESQKKQKATWEAGVASIDKTFKEAGPKFAAAQQAWEKGLALNPKWTSPKPDGVKSLAGVSLTIRDGGAVFAEKAAAKDTYTIELPLAAKRLTALRLEALADPKLPGMGPGHSGGNFVVSRVTARVVPPAAAKLSGRYVRVSLPGPDRILSLAEVQVFSGAENISPKGEAKQSSTAYEGEAKRAVDGNTDGQYEHNSVTHTATEKDPWWEVDLKAEKAIDRVVLWNRLALEERLTGYRIELLNEKRELVWKVEGKGVPKPSTVHETGGARDVAFTGAFADYEQSGFPASAVLDASPKKKNGWAVGGATGKPHTLTLLPAAGVDVPDGSKLVVTIEQQSPQANHTLGHFRLSVTDESGIADSARLPAAVLAALGTPAPTRTDNQKAAINDYYVRNVAPELKAERTRLAELTKSLAALKPSIVPIMKELTGAERRKTRLQHRGNFLDLGDDVKEGVPEALNPGTKPQVTNRLELAKWLVAPENPLTARVIANRYWEQFFGVGLVRTSEEFGIQGELPSHPELLDWLATELVRLKWDLKAFVKLLVTSAAYRQSSKVTKEMAERDPDNRLLARGPRLRLTAEMVRDQALATSGLMSPKMYGPSVKPPQPALGISAAFGGSIDWQPSPGEDKYRRGLYTEWRRSNPYPAMSTFDAPNRDVCVVRRNRTNTPLQALVTLNDPVYVEAAQALARRAVKDGGATPAEQAAYAFRLCLVRPPQEAEVKRLVALYEEAKTALKTDSMKATQLATNPLGPVPAGMDVTELAAWTVVGNVVLNLDEALMKR
jgi:mono/diheme cytochrome c family protein